MPRQVGWVRRNSSTGGQQALYRPSTRARLDILPSSRPEAIRHMEVRLGIPQQGLQGSTSTAKPKVTVRLRRALLPLMGRPRHTTDRRVWCRR